MTQPTIPGARSRRPLVLTILIAFALTACQAYATRPSAPVLTDVPVSRAPFARVHTDWKERLPQSYAYRDLRGDYRLVHDELAELRREAYRFGLSIAGPAFCLFYDDPGEIPIRDLRSRICLPVHAGEDRDGPWQFDVLPRSTVAYAAVAGPPGSVPLAYPAIYNYLSANFWAAKGPLREIYLIDPTLDARAPEALTEVQVPWTATR